MQALTISWFSLNVTLATMKLLLYFRSVQVCRCGKPFLEDRAFGKEAFLRTLVGQYETCEPLTQNHLIDNEDEDPNYVIKYNIMIEMLCNALILLVCLKFYSE